MKRPLFESWLWKVFPHLGLAHQVRKREEAQRQVEVGEDSCERQRRGRKRGGGGAWRAFVHERCRGSRLTAERARALSRDYRSLPVEEKERFAEIGRQATNAHSAGSSTFPISSRRQRLARGTGNEVLPGHQQIRVRGDVLQFQSSVCQGQPTPLPSLMTGPGETVSFLSRCNILSQWLSDNLEQQPREAAASSDARQPEIARRHEQKQRNICTSLARYDRENADSMLSRVSPRLQELPYVTWHALPHREDVGLLECEFLAEGVLADTEDAHGLHFRDGRRVASLSSAWAAKHVLVDSGSWVGQDPGARSQKKQCFEAHCCRCRRGSYVMRVYKKVEGFLKALCRDKALEKNMVDGLFVLQWCWVDEIGEDTRNHFTHIPLLYLRPWRPTFAVMTLETPHQEALQPLALDTVVSDSQKVWLQVRRNEHGGIPMVTMWEWLQSMRLESLQHKVLLAIWEVSQLPRPTHAVGGRLRVVGKNLRTTMIWRGISAESVSNVRRERETST